MRTKDSHDGRGRGGTTEQGGRRGDRGPAVRSEASPLPVFLFPSELVFYCEQRSSARRVLTLYNPYSFSLRFKMLCTAPSLYRVVEAEGSVRAKSCVDLVVRHLDVSPGNRGRRDCFRLEVGGGGREEEETRGGREDGRTAEDAVRSVSPAGAHTHTPAAARLHSCAQCVSAGGVCGCGAAVCRSVDAPPPHREQLCGSNLPPRLHQSEAGLRLHTGSPHHGVSTVTSDGPVDSGDL